MNDIAGTIRGGVLAPDLCPLDDLAGYVVERFTKSQIVRAGKLVAGNHAEATSDLVAAFNTAHAWRIAHIYPMRLVRGELGRVARKIDPDALTAGRLKRMSSIRRKLKANRTLYQIQDISGCRAIMPRIADVGVLNRIYEDGGARYTVIDRDDYIEKPKLDGYRSRHLVVRFDGPEDQTGGNRLVVEIQLRTQLQHAWATAVEAVGFVRNENMKAGKGDPDWLRLFQLMSGEIAELEDCVPPSTCPASAAERRAELTALDAKLNAIQTLDGYNQALRYAEEYLSLKGNSYLIRYDLETHRVSVTNYSQFRQASKHYLNAEMFDADQGNTVLVEVDGVEDLRDAYPNYFLDVTAFADLLRKAVLKGVAKKKAAQAPPSKFASVLHWLREPDRF